MDGPGGLRAQQPLQGRLQLGVDHAPRPHTLPPPPFRLLQERTGPPEEVAGVADDNQRRGQPAQPGGDQPAGEVQARPPGR